MTYCRGALPSNDSNAWYYPASYPETSDGEDLPVGISTGNWGRKRLKSARWIKKGKMAAWGPAKEEWQVSVGVTAYAPFGLIINDMLCSGKKTLASD
jgi:hypothetical protein